VGSHLCGRAASPVVMVPRLWRQGPMNDDPVVVALDGVSTSLVGLQFGFEQARRVKTLVIVVHATPANTSPLNDAAQEKNVAHLVATVKSDHLDTDVVVRFAHEDVDAAIVESSLSASMLVLGPSHSDHAGWLTKSVAQAVLKHSECPLAVTSRQTRSATSARQGLIEDRTRP